MSLELSPVEEAAAAAALVHVVWLVFREDTPSGGRVTRGVPLVMHHSGRDAQADADRRAAALRGDRQDEAQIHVEQDCNLLAFGAGGFTDAQSLKRFLGFGKPVELPAREWNAPGSYTRELRAVPLTAEESARAQNIPVWTVYYEDWFEVGAGRDSFPVAVCLSAREAETEVAARGAVASGRDGYLAQGPHPLVRPGERSSPLGPGVIREVLRRAAAGEAGPVVVTS